MILQQASIAAKSSQGAIRDYPPPPRVPWVVLFGASIAFDVLAGLFIPARYHALTGSVFADAWAFYLCLWLRSLDSDARSPFWCDVFVIVELTWAALASRRGLPPPLATLELLLTVASLILGIATIFLIRSDLERHYNEREPFSLHLSGVMTFIFSIYYFQYHLYKIAQLKERRAQGSMANTSRLFPG
jgi:hypothetical protein